MSVSNSARAGTEGSSRKELVRTPAVGNWLLAFGVWGTLVGVLNLFGAAYRVADGLRLAWPSVLSMGYIDGGSSSEFFWLTNQGPSLGDVAFLGLTIAMLVTGFMVIQRSMEGGIVAWLNAVFSPNFWKALVNPDHGGWSLTQSAWSILIGVIFYLFWGISYRNWVDVGVYSVSIAFVAYGFAMRMVANAPIPDEPVSA